MSITSASTAVSGAADLATVTIANLASSARV
jgi:hypothetical protein